MPVRWYRLVIHARHVEGNAAMSWLIATAIREAIKLERRDQRELSLLKTVLRGPGGERTARQST